MNRIRFELRVLKTLFLYMRAAHWNVDRARELLVKDGHLPTLRKDYRPASEQFAPTHTSRRQREDEAQVRNRMRHLREGGDVT